MSHPSYLFTLSTLHCCWDNTFAVSFASIIMLLFFIYSCVIHLFPGSAPQSFPPRFAFNPCMQSSQREKISVAILVVAILHCIIYSWGHLIADQSLASSFYSRETRQVWIWLCTFLPSLFIHVVIIPYTLLFSAWQVRVGVEFPQNLEYTSVERLLAELKVRILFFMVFFFNFTACFGLFFRNSSSNSSTSNSHS